MSDKNELKLPLACQHSGNNENIPDGHVQIWNADDKLILIVNDTFDNEIILLNFLVTAVNSHAALKEEVERLRGALERIRSALYQDANHPKALTGKMLLGSIDSIVAQALIPPDKKGTDDGRT
jgi:hypothetical protein